MHSIFGLLTATKPPATLITVRKLTGTKGSYAYNECREGATKKQTIDPENPNIILPLNDPLRQGNTHRYILAAVRMTVFFEVLANSFVGKPMDDQVKGNVVNAQKKLRTTCTPW